ncbi:MAG: TIGR02147 family protein [Fibrobacter sp.]|nr:TIGR02147 family protein [Fibrobacter sp.]
MKEIVEYHSYRKYMQDFYEERKRCSAFSWREFSKIAGFSSPNYMKVVCEGKSRLSKAGVESVSRAMGLEGFQAEYFTAMVDFEDAKTEAKKKAAFQRMQDIAKENRMRVIDADAYHYFDSWVNPVMRELAPIMPGAKPLELARKCYPVVSAAEVRHSLDFMVSVGLLKKKGEAYVQTEKSVTGSAEAIPLALRSMHRQMSKLATDAIDDRDVSERHMTGVTLGVSPKTYGRLVRELENFRRKVVAIAAEEDDYTQVYHLNLQLFPLTKDVTKEDT